MPSTAKIETYVRQFDGQYTALFERMRVEIARRLKNARPEDVQRILLEVFRKYQVDQALQDTLMDSIVKSIALGAGIKVVADPLLLKRWYLDRAYSAAGVKFSSTITDLARKDEMIATLTQAMREGTAWRTAAQTLSDKAIQGADVAKDVTKVYQLAKRNYMVSGDYEGYRAFRKKAERLQKRINKLVDPSTSKLRRAYQDIVDLSEGASAKALDKAYRYTAYFKQRYNAERIVRTESARAYGQGFHASIQDSPEVIGWRAQLSSAHVVYDICNVHTAVDLYGMGPGAYPKGCGPEFPFHPHCLCVLSEVIRTTAPEAAPSDYNPEGMEKYLAGVSPRARAQLMGRQGAALFGENRASWSATLRNWNGNGPIVPTIPEDMLFEK